MMGKSQRIRVLIVDDHAVVRQGLRTFLGMLPDIQIVGEAASGAEAVAAQAKAQPDVVLMDLVMPGDGRRGGDAAHPRRPGPTRRSSCSPASRRKTRSSPPSGQARRATCLKDVKPAELAETIRAVARGESRLAPDVTRKILSGIAGAGQRRAGAGIAHRARGGGAGLSRRRPFEQGDRRAASSSPKRP